MPSPAIKRDKNVTETNVRRGRTSFIHDFANGMNIKRTYMSILETTLLKHTMCCHNLPGRSFVDR